MPSPAGLAVLRSYFVNVLKGAASVLRSRAGGLLWRWPVYFLAHKPQAAIAKALPGRFIA
jgi:hypothetical protein